MKTLLILSVPPEVADALERDREWWERAKGREVSRDEHAQEILVRGILSLMEDRDKVRRTDGRENL